MIDLSPTEEQRLLVDTVRAFVGRELMPHEDTLERTGEVPPDLRRVIHARGKELGLQAYNIPEAFGGGGLSAVDSVLIEKELGRTSLALNECVHRPYAILCACRGQQVDRYLRPAVAGDKRDCIAMTEPQAGSDVRSMQTRAVRRGDDWVINGTKHFISQARIADFVLLFAATGQEAGEAGGEDGARKRISCFLVDIDQPGMTVSPGYRCVSHRGYVNDILSFQDCVLPGWRLMGAEGQGFALINDWLGVTRLSLAAQCVARAERAFEVALDWAATREQFGQKIGRFQGVSFKLADMRIEIRCANLLLLECAWKIDQGSFTGEDGAIAKVFCSEMLARVSDAAIQVCGGMGLMADLPLERIWRDARIERVWDGTNEIQRHIISRALLRPLGA